MRIEHIEIAWFRGAADPIELDMESKSVVVYGENGSGKSCFVDAVEYLLSGGRIIHLAHEYSGRRQERGIVNTHAPDDAHTSIRIRFAGGSELTADVERNGTCTRTGGEGSSIDGWEYRRTVLRQDEVARFISDTKGNKYSALLPLFGLDPMETAAENVRRLATSVKVEAKLDDAQVTLETVATKRRDTFGDDDDDQILKRLSELHAAYCPDKPATIDMLERSSELESALQARINTSSAEYRRHIALKEAAELALGDHVAAVRSANAKLAGAVEPLIAEKLEVLQSAGLFAAKLGGEAEVQCPACGRAIPVEEFQAHVEAEQERLKALIALFNGRKAAIETLCDTVKSLKSCLDKVDVQTWRRNPTQEHLSESFTYLDAFRAEPLHRTLDEDHLKALEDMLLPLIEAATAASKNAPPDAKQLAADRQIIEAGRAILNGKELAAAAKRASVLIAFLTALEQGVRDEIRLRSQQVIDEITTDIQDMWRLLHPREPIEDVRLYLPADADKAIDIGLKFYGKEQDSPRLTLSEGFRNSLGLCIFLAMAKREGGEDRPIFLDDVVVSLDRNHRGMIAGLLEQEFQHRQVIVLTHDREWYTELRQQLDQSRWLFKALKPYETPVIGIRWSAKTWTFDDARALLETAPDSAGNTARKIMDIELALLTEKLQVRLPYLHREKNDHRTAHDFLEQLISDGAKCFQAKAEKRHEINAEALETLRQADRLLVSWGNRASHTFDISIAEATRLIEVCERALACFDCSECKRPVHKLDAGNAEYVQCECGHLRWRYGKA